MLNYYDFIEPSHDDSELLYSIEYWGEEDVADALSLYDEGSVACAYVHPNTASAAVVFIQTETGDYSVQTKSGQFADGDCVVQPNDGGYISGTSSVVAVDIPKIGMARSIAYSTMQGWVRRNGDYLASHRGDDNGYVIDASRYPNDFTPTTSRSEDD